MASSSGCIDGVLLAEDAERARAVADAGIFFGLFSGSFRLEVSNSGSSSSGGGDGVGEGSVAGVLGAAFLVFPPDDVPAGAAGRVSAAGGGGLAVDSGAAFLVVDFRGFFAGGPTFTASTSSAGDFPVTEVGSPSA